MKVFLKYSEALMNKLHTYKMWASTLIRGNTDIFAIIRVLF